ncbi:MAG: hypothetical protein EOO39_10710 [Cytophagaceae bacterium]|nr:MAG: hypothetical protein EOO39_10710 [Cytophagaceae bacterium]
MLYFILLIATAVWHTLAMYFFLVHPRQVLKALTNERPVSLIAVDVVRFLGALNGGYVALAGWAAWQPLPLVWVGVVLANGSQFIIDLLAHRSVRWTTKLLPVTLIDCAFTVLFLLYITM